MKHLLTFLSLAFLHSSLSYAAVIVNVSEISGNVVASASGTINIDSFPAPTSGGNLSGQTFGSGLGAKYDGMIYTGTTGAALPDVYPIVTDNVFSTGTNTFADTNSGDFIGIFSVNALATFPDSVIVTEGYISGAQIDATSTWLETTIADLGLIPGTYVFNWGSGATADSLTLNISADTTDPTLLSSTPADDATGVAINSNIVLTFDEPVDVETGNITLVKAATFGFQTYEVIDVTSGLVTGSGTSTITVNPNNNFLPDTYFFVTIDDTAFDDAAGNSYAGLTGSGTLNFITSEAVLPTTYSVGGTVSGLTGTGLALQNNGADTLAAAADGPFTFATELTDGAAYAVTVSTQPTGQTCTVSNGSGMIATANVTNVAVTCVTDVIPTYSVGGTLTGLTGTGLALQNNGADTLPVAADGPFTFATELTDGAAYAVTVSTQPTGQTCSVSNGSGTIATGDVTNAAVTCVDDVVPPVVPPAPAVPIPTMSEWALILFSLLLGMMVFVNRRRLF